MIPRHCLAAAVAAGLPLAATLAPRGARAQPYATQAAAPTLARQLAEYAAGLRSEDLDSATI
ncbi:MmgE/PrpD family protein, partial [Burkholderia pseudomallei]